jgi:serine/threonine-protein phosphatase PP1 catalytic subunit
MSKNYRERLDFIITALLKNTSCQYRIPLPDISFIVSTAKSVFMSERTVLELHPPMNVCGDIHGQFTDLLRIFRMVEPPPNDRFLFLGDYVDRGPMSIECICLLLAMKSRYPNHIYLIRGNHETREMTEQYGFLQECQIKANRQIYIEFCEMFEWIPIAAVIASRIFCVHGGITPSLSNIDQIREISRPADAGYKGFLADLLWSDHSTSVPDWGPSERGDTVFWNLKPVKTFLEANGLTTLIRAHQLVNNGWEYPFAPDECVITVFSAACYAGEYTNRAAFLTVSKDLEVVPVLLPHDPTSSAAAERLGRPTIVVVEKNEKRKGKDKKGKKGGKSRHRK